VSRTRTGTEWWLRLFSKRLKKRQKLDWLRHQIGALSGQRCLLVTHGDIDLALNYHLPAHRSDMGGGLTVPRQGDLERLQGFQRR
jgi:hypothetical protein